MLSFRAFDRSIALGQERSQKDLNARYILCLVITLASGAAALSHELLWTRRLVDILGATGKATSLVLGCFFFGLSVGAAIASRRVDAVERPWRALAILEFAIAMLTLPAAFLPDITEWIWPTLGPTLLVSWPGQLAKLAISALVVVPPAIAMGMTLPLLIVAVQKSVVSNHAGKIVIYAFNTLGGAFGLLITSAWLLPSCGVLGCMFIAILTNLFVAGVAWSMQFNRIKTTERRHSRARKTRRKEIEQVEAENRELSGSLRIGLAAFSGASVLALEVVAIRLLSLVVHSSFQATSCLLLSVILLLGVAALLAPVFQLVVRSHHWQISAALSLSAIGSAAAPQLLFYRTRELVNVPALAAMDGKSLSGIFDFQIGVMSVAIVSIGTSIFFAGLVFPSLFASIPVDASGTQGRHWAMLLAANGLGGLTGAIMAENMLLPTFGIYGSMLAMGVFQAIAAVAFSFLMSRWNLAAPGVVAMVACLLFVPTIFRLPYITPRNTSRFKVEKVTFGKDGVCLITKADNSGRGILMNNQYLLGSTIAIEEQRRQVLVPLLLHNRPTGMDLETGATQLCCLGLATGMSAGAALDFDDSCHVTAIELSPMVVDAAQNHFQEENNGVVSSPRATIIVEDARTYISAVRNRFDVIAGDLYRPYGAGEGRLFSIEHFRNVRSALRPGGIYCQWIAAYQVTEEHFNMIVATFLGAFPDASLLRVESESGYPQFGLLGSRDAEPINWTQVASRCERLKARGVKDVLLQNADSVKAMYVGRLSEKYFAEERINTLNNVRLEILAGLHRVTLDPREKGRLGKDAYLKGENWRRFSHKLQEFTFSDEP